MAHAGIHPIRRRAGAGWGTFQLGLAAAASLAAAYVSPAEGQQARSPIIDVHAG